MERSPLLSDFYHSSWKKIGRICWGLIKKLRTILLLPSSSFRKFDWSLLETAFKSKRRTQTLKKSLIPLLKKGIQNDKADYHFSPLSTTRLDEESYQIVNSRSNTMQKYFRAMVL